MMEHLWLSYRLYHLNHREGRGGEGSVSEFLLSHPPLSLARHVFVPSPEGAIIEIWGTIYQANRVEQVDVISPIAIQEIRDSGG